MASNCITPPQRTPWYPASIPPVRKGLYERDHTKSRFGPGRYPIRFSYWTGSRWGGWAANPEAAFANKKNESWDQQIPWRGLAGKPK